MKRLLPIVAGFILGVAQLCSAQTGGQGTGGGPGGGVQVQGAITAGHCTAWFNSTTIEDAGSVCGGSGSSPGGSVGSFQFNNTVFGGTTLTDISYSGHTITIGSTGILNLATAAVLGGLVVPNAAGAAPTTDAVYAFNTTSHLPVFGSNGATLTYPSSISVVSHQFLTGFNNATGVFTQAQPAFSDISGTATAAQIPLTVVYNNQANTFSTGLQSFAAATLGLPSSAAYAPTSAGLFGYDSTNNRIVVGNGTNTSFPTWITTAPTNGHCSQFSGTLGLLVDSGAPCGGTFTPQTNGVNNTTLTGLNFITSTVNAVGLTITPSNPGTTQEKFEITGGSYTGNAATATNLAAGVAGEVYAGSTPAFTATPVLGVNASLSGSLGLAYGGTSGATITLQNPGGTAAGNFNICSVGASGQVLTSQGGGSSCMTWQASLTNPMTTIGDLIVGGTAGAATRLGAPTSPNSVAEVLTSTPSGGVGGTPAWGLPGMPVRAVTGTTSTDTIAATDCSPKRVAYQGSVAVAVTLPTATTLAVPNCVFKMANDTTGSTTAVTITPTTWTLNYQGTTGLTSLAVPQKQWCTLEPDPGGTSWDVDCATTNLGTVTGPGSSTNGDLASFNGTSGIVLQDSGVVAANVITDSGSLTTHGVAIASGSKTITSTSVGATNTLLHGNTGADPTYSGVVIADLTATGSPSSTTFLRGDNTWATPSGTSLPSGTQGYPLINTNGSTTYATDLLCIDAAKASSGADAGIRAQNAEAAVNGNSSPCVDSRSEIGTTIASSVNPFISTFSGKWYAPAGALQLANVSAVVGGSVEVEGVTIGTNSANGSLLQALHGSWGAAQGGDFTGGSYASPPTWNSGNFYFWGDCVVNSSVNYCAIGDNLGSGNVPGTDWVNWTLMSSMPSPVVQPQLNAVNTSKTSKQNTAFHNITFDCQFVPASGATGLTDQCATFMNFTGQELWVLDRVMMRNPSVAGVWMEDFVPNFGHSSGQVVYSAPSATACSGSPCDQSAAKVNTADSLNKGLQGAAISTITVAGSSPALATITLSSAPSFPLIRGFADIINVGGTGNVSGMTPFAAGVVDETANSHGFWQVWSVQSTTVINIIVPNGTAGCASSCGNYYQFPVAININSNSKQNERGFVSWTLNASNTPATTANTAFSDYPPLAVQLSTGNVPFEDNHGEGWRVFTCIGCFAASDGQTIKNSWPNINTHTGFLLSNSFGIPTNFNAVALRCNITGGGSTGTMVDHLIDVGNGNTITCANNPVIDYYRTDGNGYAYAQMKNCSEMTKGQCFDGTSASGTYLAGIRINGVNPSTGIQVFGGTTSGSASIGVAAVAGTPSTLLLPTSDGTSGQALVSGTPSGGKNQLSWLNAVTNPSNLANNGLVIGSGGASGVATVAGLTTDGVSKITLGVAGTSVGAVIFNNATSGAVTLQTVTGALGTVTASLPANTGTLAELNLAQTWTAVQALGSSTATTQSQNDNSTKLSTTAYTDLAVANAVAGVNPAVAVLAASTANLTGTYVQVGGGIGDTFTITATGAFTLDGIAISTIGQRVLFKNQTTASQNGVYTATIVGTTGVSAVFTRALDYDTPSDVNNTGVIPVQSGTVNANTGWLLTSQVTSIGSSGSSLTYTQFTQNAANVVLAVSPGAGIAHFAGSTQTVTSSALALTDMATQGADTVVANMTGGTAVPTAVAIPTTAHGVWLGEGTTTAPGITAAGALGSFLAGAGASTDPSFVALSAINPQTATYQVLAADFSGYKTISVASGTFTITLVASGSQPANGQYVNVVNYGSGVVTIARSGQNINGAAANFTLNAGSASAPTSSQVWSDGTNYFATVNEAGAGSGTVTSVGTTSPITGGTFTTSGTIACATCVTSASSLTSNALMTGAGSQGSQTVTTGTGVVTALGVNVGSAGAFVVNGGALGTPSSGALPINQVVSATGAIATIADGNNPLVVNCALTSGTTCLTTGETTAATTAGAVEHQITTLTTTTAIPLQITQGAAGPANAAAPNVLNISAAAAGGASGASNAGSAGAAIGLLTGAGSAGGATTGNGGAGGAFTITEGAGGAAGGTSTNGGGNGGGLSWTTGPGGNGGTGAATAGSGGGVTFTLGAPGTNSATGTAGTVGLFNVTGNVPASTANAAGVSAGTLFSISGVAGGATSNTGTSTGGIGSSPSITGGTGGAATGAGTTATVGGAGGSVTLTGGNGGNGTAGNDSGGNGGNIILAPGAGGTKTGSGVAGNSGLVQVSTALTVGSSPPNCQAGTGGPICANEGTAPTAVALVDDLYANSTSHCYDVINGTVDVGCILSGPDPVAANGPLVLQAGIDATTQASSALLTLRGEDVTGGSTATLTGGAVAIRGGNNASTGNTNIGGAVTINGGNATGGTGTSDAGGAVSETGGNCTSTTGGCVPGTWTATAGGFTAAFTNGAGSDAVVASGLGTGNAAVSHVKLKSPALSQTSGTTAETQVTRWVTHVKAGSTTTATATNMFNVAMANNQTAGFLITVHVETTQATPHNCSTTQTFLSAVQETSGTVTQQTTAGPIATICDTGTLTLAAAFSAAAPSVFSVTPSWTTIVPTAVTITIEVQNLSQQEIALL